MRLHALAIAVCLIFVVTGSDAAPVKPKKIEKRPWVLTQSPNFKVISDAKPDRVKRMVAQLERFRAFSSWLLEVDNDDNNEPIVLIATKSRPTWSALGLPPDYVSLTHTVRNGRTTIFADIKGFTAKSSRRSSMARSTVFSSVAFKLFHDVALSDTAPLWYLEGFGQYLSGFVELDTKFRIGDLEAMGPRLTALFNPYGRVKAIDVIALMSRQSYKNSLTDQMISNSAQANFLAQAYLLVHYLYADSERRSQLADFLATQESGEPLADRIYSAFGVSAEQLALDLVSYAEAQVSVTVYDRAETEPLLNLPDLTDYVQEPITVPDFWREVYPRLVDLSEDYLTFDEKKQLREQVKQHLPKPKSLFD